VQCVDCGVVYVFCVLQRDLRALSRTSGAGFSFTVVAAKSFFCLVEVLLSQPHFGLSVRVKPTLPKVGS
jgi:hypothetical protein